MTTAMPPALAFLSRQLSAARTGEPNRSAVRFGRGLLVLLHFAALALLAWSEVDLAARIAFILAWGFVNLVFIAILRRPLPAAALTLLLFTLIVLLSRFKHGVLLMTVNFLDVMIIDSDTVSFVLTIFPNLWSLVVAAAVVVVPTIGLLWWVDPFRLRARTALIGGGATFALLCALSLGVPSDLYEEFANTNYVSKFARSGVTGTVDLFTRGYLESDETVAERLSGVGTASCQTPAKPPHIVMVFDESSFDITRVPGVTVNAGYQDHFRSFDGKSRTLLVEGAGGPSWYTEYNVLTGLSVRSYGRFADFVTRIAAGRVERGLPASLKRCGYKTFSLYPMWGAFAGARQFQQTTGIEHFLDSRDLGTRGIEPDAFYYDNAVKVMTREKGDKPLFMFVYTAANHFPWTYRFHGERTPDWKPTGNAPEVDEYLRRQNMSATDYKAFVERLKKELPGEPILIVRFGDHQPSFAKHMVDPALDDTVIARRLAEADPRFLATYYAIEGINFDPADLSSALDVLDAPYLPIVVMEAAGLPLDPSFTEQKRVMKRCNGLFYRCAAGGEAKRLNRLLIEAGLIKRL
jgi:phosphoglycerol transferase MdoB-like AlkP superfamily enzyme